MAKVFRLLLCAIAVRSVAALVNPAVGLEPAEGADDTLLDREFSFPAG